jgi:glucosamine kinase
LPQFLGLDVGGSSTRWTLIDDYGHVNASGQSVGFSAGSSIVDVIASASKVFAEIKQHFDVVQSVAAGITGLSRGSETAASLARMLADVFSTSDVSVMSDIELQCRSHFAPGRGILVYSGTGSIAGHMSSGGRLSTSGGRGVNIDDAGGAYWIATAGLRTILRLEDRSPSAGWSTPMGLSYAMMLGGSEWGHIKTVLASKSRGEFALLARCVADAGRKGDPLALGILRQAGSELALLADMLIDRVGMQPIILTGRASELHSEILMGMREALPDIQVVQKFAEASAAAARIAQGHTM